MCMFEKISEMPRVQLLLQVFVPNLEQIQVQEQTIVDKTSFISHQSPRKWGLNKMKKSIVKNIVSDYDHHIQYQI